MAHEDPDMEDFPLIRPDLIPRLADIWLERALLQLRPLIESLASPVRR